MKDPHFKRESKKYDIPVPSREFIADFLKRTDRLFSHLELCQEFNIVSEEEIEGLRRRLIAMSRDGQLTSNRDGGYTVVDEADLVTGIVQAHSAGYGFVTVKDGEDVFVSDRQMKCCFDGDLITVRIMGVNFKGKPEGKVVKVVSSNTDTIVGRFTEDEKQSFVMAENKRINHEVLIQPGQDLGAQTGDIVSVEITAQPQFRKPPVGKVVQIVGQNMAPGMEIDIALRSHEIPHVWPMEVEQQLENFQTTVKPEDLAGRVDLRDKAFVTIDGEDARDFDDAVYASKKRDGGFNLLVAIADVSHYVEVGSALDQEAHVRGTSVYFPERVIPMLPELLSNGLCSLNPNVDRLTMVCDMVVSSEGKIESYQFYEAVIHSHARLTYNQVHAFLSEGEDIGVVPSVIKSINNLNALYLQFLGSRKRRGAIDFETTETRIVFNDERKIEKIVPVHRNEAHKLIEECMLAANQCTANFLESLEITGLYRVHEGPKEERLEKLRGYLSELGLNLGGGDAPTSKDYQHLIAFIRTRDDAELIQTMMLRSLSQAVYQPENLGHFGLGFKAYTHFTSPIRRYPDLLTHRAIREVIRTKRKTPLVRRTKDSLVNEKGSFYPYSDEQMLQLGEHCSSTERRADEATWDVLAWLKCEFMKERVGNVYAGKVAGVTGFGLFVQLDEIFVDGLIHVSSLQADFYHFDEAKHRLIGERSRNVFSMGDPMKVRVVRVDLDERKIDFEWVHDPMFPPKKAGPDDTPTKKKKEKKTEKPKKKRVSPATKARRKKRK